ncbi:hypothetical protein [Paenibacillus filicis]
MLDSFGNPRKEQLLTSYDTDSAVSTADTGEAIAGQLGYALFTDLNDDKQKYRSITKIGLTDKELEGGESTAGAVVFRTARGRAHPQLGCALRSA